VEENVVAPVVAEPSVEEGFDSDEDDLFSQALDQSNVSTDNTIDF